MFPILGNRANLAAYLLGWLFVGFAYAGLSLADGASLMDSAIFGGISAIFASVLFLPVYFPCAALRPNKTSPAVLLSSLVALAAVFGAVWTCAAFAAFHALRLAGHESFYVMNFLNLALIGFVSCALTEAIFYVHIAHSRSREAERLEQELRVMAREAELRALRAQINPHFLFNSLNSISALTSLDPARARDMCILLSDFLRKGLRLGERYSVTLSEELDLLKNYCAIEQIRFAPKLNVDWEISDACLSAEIPILLLQPLVENAVKHGISQMVDGGTIRIKAEAINENVSIQLENPTEPGIETAKGLGLGMKQVHQRLAAFFGGEGRMEVCSKDGMHSVCLVFPLIIKESDNE